MKKRNLNKLICIVATLIMTFFAELLTIKIGLTRNMVIVIITSCIYLFLSILASVDLFYALNGGSNYPKEYHELAFYKQFILLCFALMTISFVLDIFNNSYLQRKEVIGLFICVVIVFISLLKISDDCERYLDEFVKKHNQEFLNKFKDK